MYIWCIILQPANILIHKGWALIADFGLALKVKPGELITTDQGTPNFQAPEIHLGKINTVDIDDHECDNDDDDDDDTDWQRWRRVVYNDDGDAINSDGNDYLYKDDEDVTVIIRKLFVVVIITFLILLSSVWNNMQVHRFDSHEVTFQIYSLVQLSLMVLCISYKTTKLFVFICLCFRVFNVYNYTCI